MFENVSRVKNVRRRWLVAAGLLLLDCASAVAASSFPVQLYIGPVVEDGFVEADSGVIDSIADLRKAFRKELGKGSPFVLVQEESKATVRIRVNRSLGYSSGGYSGTVTRIGGTTIGSVTPAVNEWKMLSARVQVCLYEKRFVAIDGGWKKLSKRLSKDIATWLSANHAPIQECQELRARLQDAIRGTTWEQK